MADSAAQKKPGFIDRVKRFFRDIKGEVKKIVWPSKKQVINNTVIVVIMGVISAIVVACFDTVATLLIHLFTSLLG